MVDRYVETTRQGWFSRVGGSFGGALVGLLMFLVAFPVLFWNEGRAVERARDLAHGRDSVVTVIAKPDAANDGKLIHTSAEASPVGQAVDPVFEVHADALRLARSVEMYQWKEHKRTSKKEKIGGSEETRTEYTYEKIWSERPISSSGFKVKAGHQNPGSLPYESETFAAPKVALGEYTLTPTFVNEIPVHTSYSASDPKLPPGGQPRGGGIYVGTNPSSPQIGDVRITFTIAPARPVTVVGAQQGDQIVAYSDDEMSGELALLEPEKLSAEQMFQNAQDANYFLTWVLRFVGFVLMFGGLRLAARPLRVVGSVIPFVGKIIGFGTGLVAFFVALALSGITIAVAWLFYRPLLALLIIAFAVMMGAAAIAVVRRSAQR